MNDNREPGPCAAYEHLIVEMLDGSLGSGDARAVHGHLAGCPRCRAFEAEWSALDERLAGALPRPDLSPDFARKLRERIAAETRRAPRGDLRLAADDEYRRTVDALRRGSRRSAILGAAGAAMATACALVVLRTLLPEAGGLLTGFAGAERAAALQALGGAIALAALAWAGARGALPAFRLRP